MQAQVTHEWVTYRQAEEITGLSRTTLRKLVGEGEIRIRRVGRAVRINRAGWSVGLVRECLSVIASAAGEDLEELMVGARERARLDVISAKSAAGRVEEQLQNMRRERLLPDDRTLEKVSRYEAHLSRLMFKALHELEALQVRRAGGAAPLARLDVDGLAES